MGQLPKHLPGRVVASPVPIEGIHLAIGVRRRANRLQLSHSGVDAVESGRIGRVGSE